MVKSVSDPWFPIYTAEVRLNFSAEPSFAYLDGIHEIPVGDNPGRFGAERRHHTHEGIDIYCREDTEVCACERGMFMGYFPFTGEHAGSPWWEETWAAVVRHDRFYLVYGEIQPERHAPGIRIGSSLIVNSGQSLGTVKRVLKEDKGRPMSMLHLEMYSLKWNGIDCADWKPGTPQPEHLMDPTQYLLNIAHRDGMLS